MADYLDLLQIVLSGLADRDTLLWNAASGSWVNGPGGSSGGGTLLATVYNKNATGGILICSQYDPTEE